MRTSTLAGEKSFNALAERFYGKLPKTKQAAAVQALRESNPVLAAGGKFPAKGTVVVPSVPAIDDKGGLDAMPAAVGGGLPDLIADGLEAVRIRLRAGTVLEKEHIKATEELLARADVQAFLKELSRKQQRSVETAPAARKKLTSALTSILKSERFRAPGTG